jgi:hypothetical protein
MQTALGAAVKQEGGDQNRIDGKAPRRGLCVLPNIWVLKGFSAL